MHLLGRVSAQEGVCGNCSLKSWQLITAALFGFSPGIWLREGDKAGRSCQGRGFIFDTPGCQAVGLMSYSEGWHSSSHPEWQGWVGNGWLCWDHGIVELLLGTSQRAEEEMTEHSASSAPVSFSFHSFPATAAGF